MNNTKRFILKQIYEDMEISRKEIAAKLNLSKTIVGKYINNFIIFNIDDGVGAGEIGHTLYNYSKDAPICSCSNKGYLETYLANWQVINRVKKEQNLSLTYDDIIQKANNGDSYFRTLLFDLSKAISHGILWTEYLLNPKAIIIIFSISINILNYFYQNMMKILF